jgi:hypothetical protein
MPNTTTQDANVTVMTKANTVVNPPIDENGEPHCVQNINVTVKIDQKEDGFLGLFKALARIFRKKS